MLLTIQDVAQHLQIKPSTLYAWVAQGKIPCVRLNGLVRFAQEDIDAWVEANRKKMASMKARQVGGRVIGDVKGYVARLRGAGHNGVHGETRSKAGSIRKEERDGAL